MHGGCNYPGGRGAPLEGCVDKTRDKSSYIRRVRRRAGLHGYTFTHVPTHLQTPLPESKPKFSHLFPSHVDRQPTTQPPATEQHAATCGIRQQTSFVATRAAFIAARFTVLLISNPRRRACRVLAVAAEERNGGGRGSERVGPGPVPGGA